LDATQWAGQASLALPADEVKYVINGFANPGTLFAAGPKVHGEKHMCTRGDASLIILKHGTHGVVACKSAKCVVVCTFDEAHYTPAQANVAVQNFSDYMKSIGF